MVVSFFVGQLSTLLRFSKLRRRSRFLQEEAARVFYKVLSTMKRTGFPKHFSIIFIFSNQGRDMLSFFLVLIYVCVIAGVICLSLVWFGYH